MQNTATPSEPSRRDFLAATAVGAASLTAVSNSLHAALFVAGSDLLKVGLIGCGGRGTGSRRTGVECGSSDGTRRIGRCL